MAQIASSHSRYACVEPVNIYYYPLCGRFLDFFSGMFNIGTIAQHYATLLIYNKKGHIS